MLVQILVFVSVAVVLPLSLSEFTEWCPRLAEKLVSWAASRLGSKAEAQRYEEEWRSVLEAVPGKLSKLGVAIGLVARVRAMRHEVEPRVEDEVGDAEPILAEPRNMLDEPDVVRISELFDKEIRPGGLYTRQSITEAFGGSMYTGIAPSPRSPTVTLYSDPEKEVQLGYKAGWEVERDGSGPVMWYTGEGSRGDQSLTRGNRALLRHREECRVLRVFQASGTVHGSHTKVFRYLGEFEIDPVRPFEMGLAPDQDGEKRQVFHFRLRPAPGRNI